MPPENLGERAGGSIVVVYEAAGASQLAFDVLGQLGPNAVFVFTGVPGRKGPIEFDARVVMRRLVLGNQVALGTVNAGHDAYEQAIADLARFRERWPDALRAAHHRSPPDRRRGRAGGRAMLCARGPRASSTSSY